jgi:glycosyltransferase involved in cell wall biosynthesis
VTGEPDISVVVSTRDRAPQLARLLESLRRQTLDAEEFEVVVVDDGSRDATPDVLARETRRGELQLRMVRLADARGPAAGRNAGWRAARAQVIAFTDDDCEADACWLEALLASARENPDTIVQGRTDPATAEIDAAGVFIRTLAVTGPGPFFHTCNIAYRRALLEELGGFDEGTFGPPGGEDTDLAWRAIARGAQTMFADDARVRHAVNYLGPIGGLRLALRWSDTMAVFGRHAAMRERLHRGLFWKRSHELLFRALLGAALARRFPPAVLLAYPYLRDAVLRTRKTGSDPIYVPYVVLQDLVEAYATLRGALRHRVLVL